MQYEVFETPLGPMGVVVRTANGKQLLVAVRIGLPTRTSTEIEILKRHPNAAPSKNLDAARLLIGYAETGAADFSSLILDEDSVSPFDRAVRSACRRIPSGSTVTYGELAELAREPRRAARAVGGVMRRNSCPIVVPCHRVVPAGKTWALGNYSAPQGPSLKRRLLEHEGFSETPLPRSKTRRRTPNRRFGVAPSLWDE
jgi:methylated-DNA-[protein]-cysteine S-methyltransferase